MAVGDARVKHRCKERAACEVNSSRMSRLSNSLESNDPHETSLDEGSHKISSKSRLLDTQSAIQYSRSGTLLCIHAQGNPAKSMHRLAQRSSKIAASMDARDAKTGSVRGLERHCDAAKLGCHSEALAVCPSMTLCKASSALCNTLMAIAR